MGVSARLRALRSSPPSAALVGFVAYGLLTLAVSAGLRGRSRDALSTRLLHAGFDLGHFALLGVLAALTLFSFRRLESRPKARLALLAAGYFGLATLLLREDLGVFAGKLSGVLPASVLSVGMFALLAALLSVWTMRVSAPTRTERFVFAGSGIVIGAVNPMLLRGDYPGVHLVAAWVGALGLGTALADVAVRPSRAAKLGLAVSLLAGLVAAFVPPPNAVLLRQHRTTGSYLAPWLARARRPARSEWPRTESPWLVSRKHAPEIPPSAPRSFAESPIVLLFTSECIRADVVSNPAYLARLPNFARLRREGIYFSEARSTAPGTSQALASLFTSTMYSGLEWANLAGRGADYFFPHLDPTPRLPELLKARGFTTASVQGLPRTSQRHGLVRGMDIEHMLPGGAKGFAGSQDQLPVILEILRSHQKGPLFLYAHFDDPHFPYDRAGDHGARFDDYLAEIALVDTTLGAVWKTVEELGIAQRTALVFSADHGEAFGEHDMLLHATSLYEEQIRIPLLARIPGRGPVVIEEPVSLLDVGPTLLDLLGLPTPGHALGQSLSALVAGKREPLTRPLALESGRALRGIVFPDRFKLIRDLRAGSVELYDLAHDPGELVNLVDARPRETRERLAFLDRYFEVHRFEAPGYTLPFAR